MSREWWALKAIFVGAILLLSLGLPMGGQAQSVSQVGDGDWPMLAHDLRRSGSTSIEVEPPYTIKWVRDFYSADNETSEIVFSQVQPIVVNGLVYVGTSRNNMYALDSDTGETVWKYRAGEGRGEIVHSPAVSDDVLYFGSTDGYLYALDVQTGGLLWKYGIDCGGFRSSPAVTQDTVYIGGTDGFFYALNATDGGLRWRYKTDGPVLNSPAIDLLRGRVYFGSEDMHAYALNLDDGGLVWRSGKLYGVSMRHYYPVIVDDMVIFRTSPGNAWRALRCGDTVLGRAAGLDIPEDCTWLRDDSPRVDIHATPGPGDIASEQNAIQSWLTDPQHIGHRTFYVLSVDTGRNVFTNPVPVLWSQGCGDVGEPPVVTTDGRVLLRWRSYYGDIDNANSAYLFSAIGELDQDAGRIIPFNLAEENSYYRTGIFMISDEPGVFSVGGDRLYIYSHADSVGSVSLSTHEAAMVFSSRDIPWGVGSSGVFPGQRNLLFGPYDNNYTERFTPFSGCCSHAVTIADGKLFWVANGMLGAVEHGDGPQGSVTPPLDGDPVFPPELSISIPDPSELEEYVLEVEEYTPDWTKVSDLRARLEAEVEDLISGDRYAPFFLLSGKNNGRLFFADPSEELYVLSISFPYLSPALQAQVRAYLAETITQYDPLRDQYPVEEGRRRERYEALGIDNWQACQEDWYCSPRVPPLEERLYHLWTYAHYTGDWSFIEDNWQAIRDRMHGEIDPNDPESLLASRDDVSLNRRVSSLIAYTRMAGHLGDQDEYQWGLDAATKGLAARIEFEDSHRPQYGAWIGERRLPAHNEYFMETNWGQGGYIPRYLGLTPEIGHALRDYAWEDMQLQDTFIETVVPAQYLSWSLAVGRNEQFTSSPTQALEVYLAKALIMQEDSETLRQYVNIPWCRGDLYYIEKLVLAIRASAAELDKAVTPHVVDYGDVLTYTITLVGTGGPMTVTDPIPAGTIYLSGSARQAPAGVGTLNVDAEQIRWTGTLTQDFSLDITFGVTIAVTAPTVIQNIAFVYDGETTSELSATVIANGYETYLPVIVKDRSAYRTRLSVSTPGLLSISAPALLPGPRPASTSPASVEAGPGDQPEGLRTESDQLVRLVLTLVSLLASVGLAVPIKLAWLHRAYDGWGEAQ